MEVLGLIVFASLFVYSGLTHLFKHKDMVAYTTSAFGSCPLAPFFGFLGGWPTGFFLTVFGVGTVINESSVFAYGLAAFLAVTTLLFHRNLKDPANLKQISLLGAALYIALMV